MQKKLITGKFIESLGRPNVVNEDLSNAYVEMATDEAREADAESWTEAMIGDAIPYEELADDTG